MKKLTSAAVLAAFLLAGCAGSGNAVNDMAAGVGSVIGGMINGGNTTETGSTEGKSQGITASLIKMYVNNQCVTNLQARQEWRTAALLMTAEKQAEWEDKICGCVSEEAPQHITAADLANVMTETGRAKLMTEITTKTVTACYKRLFTDSIKETFTSTGTSK